MIAAAVVVSTTSAAVSNKAVATPMSLGHLCLVCKRACDVMAPMITSFYSAINSDTSKLKADASVFTIADGIVQHILIDHLFSGSKFRDVVGEEDGCNVNIRTIPFKVDNLTVPEEFNEVIESVVLQISLLADEISAEAYNEITVFIDPIDGTREFSTNLGEQCSVCIGFSCSLGKPMAGLVYRPLTDPPTWAAGAASEKFTASNLAFAAVPNTKGLLTSNGAISPFVEKLIEEYGYIRVPSGGAGNKMLMLLEGKGSAYIQDRGVSRWDTSGAQAVIEANGGTLSKLTSFISSKELQSYTYLRSGHNLDFEPGVANLTPFNCADKGAVKKGEKRPAVDCASVQPYSNLCGLLALEEKALLHLDSIHEAMLRVISVTPPSYD
jgi:3'-phosphoadenosine 5'-phosphosulfate (PAPS) 3'-phosphatase